MTIARQRAIAVLIAFAAVCAFMLTTATQALAATYIYNAGGSAITVASTSTGIRATVYPGQRLYGNYVNHYSGRWCVTWSTGKACYLGPVSGNGVYVGNRSGVGAYNY